MPDPDPQRPASHSTSDGVLGSDDDSLRFVCQIGTIVRVDRVLIVRKGSSTPLPPPLPARQRQHQERQPGERSPAEGQIEVVLSGGQQVRVRGPVNRPMLADVLAVLSEDPPGGMAGHGETHTDQIDHRRPREVRSC